MTDWKAFYTKILSAGSNYEKAKKNIISTIILILLTSLTLAQTEKSIELNPKNANAIKMLKKLNENN